jgi:hypothetical protein
MNDVRILSNLVWARLGAPWEVSNEKLYGDYGASFHIHAEIGEIGISAGYSIDSPDLDLWRISETLAMKIKRAYVAEQSGTR